MKTTDWRGLFTALFISAALFLPHPVPAQSPMPPIPQGQVLNFWPFDETNLLSGWGFGPKAATNLTLVPSWNNYSLQMDDTNPCVLIYDVVDTNSEGVAKTNITFTKGSVELWFSSDWNSGDDLGSWGTLLEAGNWDTNLTTNSSAWGLYFSPDSSSINFSIENGGIATNYLSAPISWNAGDWHYVVLTYDATNTNVSLYLEGELVTSVAVSLTNLPSPEVLSNGFAIGSDGNGSGMRQMRGQVADLWTYNYALDADTISNYYAFMAADEVYPLPAIGFSPGGGFGPTDDSPNPGGGGGGFATNSDFTFDTSGLWLQAILGTNSYTTNGNSSNVTVVLNNTIADIEYELFSATNISSNTTWTLEQTVIGSELTNFTITTVVMAGRSNLFFKALASTLDSNGEGLPDWWQLKYFGHLGIDPYGDPMGDGWSNLQKYENGINPNVFYTPPMPTGVVATIKTNGNVTISWNPAANLPTNGAGAVTGYTISFDFTNFTVAANQTNLTINDDADVLAYLSDTFNYPLPGYSVQVNYARANSSWTLDSYPFNPQLAMEAYTVRGANGKLNLVVSTIPAGVQAIRVFVNTDNTTGAAVYPRGPYAQVFHHLATEPGSYSFDLPTSSFSNGVYVIPDSLLPLYGVYQFQTCAIGGDGTIGPPPPDLQFVVENPVQFNIPFLDGRAQIKQNLAFWLQTASKSGQFNFTVDYVDGSDGLTSTRIPPGNAAYAGFHTSYFESSYGIVSTNVGIGEFQPLEDNYGLHNFLFDVGDLKPSGFLGTGVYFDPFADSGTYNHLSNNAEYMFDTFGFVSATNTTPPSPVLSGWQWTYYPNPLGLSDIGISENVTVSPPQFLLPSGQTNFFGLAYQSAERAYSTNGVSHLETLYPGGSLSDHTNNYYFYPAVAAADLETVGYYFARPSIDPLPDDPAFVATDTTAPLMIASLAQPFAITAWAKQAILNGDPTKFAYPEQYFDKAYAVDTNGVVTANATGILSPYGEFFPIEPGPTALVTMPDIDTGLRATNIIQVISLNVDANHDGTMDTSFTGPDFASPARPFVFWANSNYDRNVLDSDGANFYDDDVLVAGDYYTNSPTPDCNFLDASGHRVIPCERDLQDFTRLWISGVNSNLLAGLPSGSTVTLSWADIWDGFEYTQSGNPSIDLFVAADPDGGIGYLTNGLTGAIQAENTSCPYVGRIGPGRSVQLNSSQFAGNWAGNHFIWCGVSNGSGALNLTIADGGGNPLAQATIYIQIEDIKQMYERWTVGDNPNNAPTNVAQIAQNDLAAGETAFQYSEASDTNTPYILYVHGWNMQLWEKDRFAESAFKRLYWQGYQGRFGLFRWPTDSGFAGAWTQLLTSPSEKDNYDSSENQAWLSATGLLNTLKSLNEEYPGRVYMLAHSMGNVVAGEALRLSGTAHVVNTYVASQAAITAHTYDTNVPNYSFSFPPLSLSADTPNIYRNWFESNYGGGAQSVISFYNTNDYALQRSAWQLDQLLKPDHNVGEGNFSWSYDYLGATNDPPPWNNFRKSDTLGANVVNFDIVNNITNRYEVMAFAAQPYTTALGDTATVSTLTGTLALPTVWLTDPSGHNYTDHFWHSAEFRGDSWQQRGYWNALLGPVGFEIQ